MDDREPWWIVTGVFDPDGTGSDFSYTEGLAEKGLPELHIWARPTLGDDPGLDWKLSVRDTGRILNGLAWRLIDGDLQVGDSWEQTYDEGYVRARFSVHEAVESGVVDAFGAGDSLVLPIKWELLRDPIGPPAPMDASDQAGAEEIYAEQLEQLSDAAAPAGWELPALPSWSEQQRFGPRTPLVLARAARIWQADGDALIDVLDTAMVVGRFTSPSYALLVARAAARAPGRQAAIEQVGRSAEELLAGFGTTWGRRAHEEMQNWMLGDADSQEMADDLWRTARDHFDEAVTACLVVEVVADLLPIEIQTLGQGVVLRALGPAAYAPDPRWECSEVVGAAVAELVAATPAGHLRAAASAWEEVSSDERCWELLVLRWTGSSYAPVISARRAVQEWVNALATVLTFRVRLDPELVDTFLAAGRKVRGLRELVNTPLVMI